MVESYGLSLSVEDHRAIMNYLGSFYTPGTGKKTSQSDLSPSGRDLYLEHCARCHGEDGKGVLNAFPPLAIHAPRIVSLEHGRAYLIRAILYGIEGPIEVEGAAYELAMPSFTGSLSDEEIEQMAQEYSDCKREWLDPEKPRRKVYLRDYYIGKYAVTNEQFSKFAVETGCIAQGIWREYAESGREKHPVVCVTWSDATAYCKWAGLRLPGDAEWEKAAIGSDGRKYPWGNNWDRNLCNNASADKSDLIALRTPGSDCSTIPVGQIPEGGSPYGALDMAGNVWEWRDCSSRADLDSSCGSSHLGDKVRVLRGGSWHGETPIHFRCASRLCRPPDDNGLMSASAAPWQPDSSQNRERMLTQLPHSSPIF